MPSATTAVQQCPDDVVVARTTPIVAATATSHEKAPALPPFAVKAATAVAAGGSGCVAVLDPDGTLTGLLVSPRRPDGSLDQGPNADRLIVKNVEAVQQAVNRLAADEPELDPVRIISLAARRHPEPTVLYLITSGLSAVPVLDLNRLDWNDGGRRPGRWLVAERHLPDLTGWQVHLIGLGDVAGAQPEIGDAARARLRLLWLDICAETHAECHAAPGALRTSPPTSTNTVTVVRPPNPPTYPDPVRLPGPTLFGKDSAELSTGVDDALRRVVAIVVRAGLRLEIIGRTDALTGSTEHNKVLSQRRADAVRDRLVHLGLPPSAIVRVVGEGSVQASVEAERRDPHQVDRDRHVEIRFVGSGVAAVGAQVKGGVS